VTVNFTEAPPVVAKVAVGVDGLFSPVRRQLVGDAPVYCGQLNWNAIVPTGSLPRALHASGQVGERRGLERGS
jgi:2-polyprenyl-6-methoxyphenol hydroxylase-like FAD-dependent oxidoreductase